jgi:hypothetical protein
MNSSYTKRDKDINLGVNNVIYVHPMLAHILTFELKFLEVVETVIDMLYVSFRFFFAISNELILQSHL